MNMKEQFVKTEKRDNQLNTFILSSTVNLLRDKFRRPISTDRSHSIDQSLTPPTRNKETPTTSKESIMGQVVSQPNRIGVVDAGYQQQQIMNQITAGQLKAPTSPGKSAIVNDPIEGR